MVALLPAVNEKSRLETLSVTTTRTRTRTATTSVIMTKRRTKARVPNTTVGVMMQTTRADGIEIIVTKTATENAIVEMLTSHATIVSATAIGDAIETRGAGKTGEPHGMKAIGTGKTQGTPLFTKVVRGARNARRGSGNGVCTPIARKRYVFYIR